jgi:hypothetical protein
MQPLVRRVLLAAAALACAACADDKPTKPQAATGPAAAPSLSAQATDGIVIGTSTVCVAYAKERDGLNAELANAPGDARLQDQVRALDALIADACN